MNIVAVIVAGVVSWLVSFLYYSPLLLGMPLQALDPKISGDLPPLWKVGAEIVRSIAIAFTIAMLVSFLPATAGRGAAMVLGLWAWLGYSALMWMGAILWQNARWQLAAIYSGEMLLKTLIVTAIVGGWR